MDQSNSRPNAAGSAPVESRFPLILRATGIGVLVLVLWSIDKVAVRRFPQGSAWRYIIGAIVISMGLATVILVIDRLNDGNS